MNINHSIKCGLAAVALFSAAAVGEVVENPVPEPMPDANIRVDLELVADGLVSPVWGTAPKDGSGRFFIVDQAGQVWILQDGELSDQPYIDVSDHMVDLQEGFDERGLIGFAFHPDFAAEGESGYGRFYTYTSEPFDPQNAAEFTIDMPDDLPPNHMGVISEWQVDDHTTNQVSADDRRVVMTFDEPQFNHNGGALVFGPDKMLYLSLGDGGAANDTAPGHTDEIGNAQDTTNVLGSILRFDPLGEAGPKPSHGRYAIPEDNPFLDDDDVLDVIYAYGLRNVFLMSFAPDGRLVAADVGQEELEIVNIIEAGGNYGWNLKEGTFYFEPDTGDVHDEPLPSRPEVPEDVIDPVVQYDHDEGTSIMGGFVYRGDAVDVLDGLYVFGDWQHQLESDDGTSGRLFVADLDAGEVKALPISDGDSHTGDLVTGFGEDEDGEIYVLTNDTAGPSGEQGRVWKIVPHED